uniref:Protein MON2 homolog n=1 Tax=Heterorhabditis bacteriophora TaxID=37862 RepID=A0A1I7XFC8_HETBA
MYIVGRLLMSVVAPTDSKKLVEALLGDLRLLSTEAKKKHNHVKEAAESGVVRVRNISTASSDVTLLTNLRTASSELLHPLALACATRQTKLVQIALQSIQRLVQHRILEASCAGVVVSELWGLVEAECEELRVLQTVPPLVSADLLVSGNSLAKCIVMCFRLHFAKDPVVINAASAAVRQLVGCVFERVIQEDGIFSGELTVVAPSGGRPSPRSAPPTLRPCAADAYMLFRDLCLLINAKPSVWLVGIHEMTRTLGLELIESLLKSYPGVFFRVCLILACIFYFLNMRKNIHLVINFLIERDFEDQASERECLIYYQHPEFCELLKDEVCPLVISLFSPNLKSVQVSSQHPFSRASISTSGVLPDRPYFPIAMRVVRIIVVLLSFYHQLLPTECEIFISALLKFVDADRRGWQRSLALEALHRIVIRSDIVRLDSLEKHEASTLPDGYAVSRSCAAISDLTQAVFAAVDTLCLLGTQCLLKYFIICSSSNFQMKTLKNPTILSTDETVTDQLLCSVSILVSIGCKLGATDATHRCLYILCTASLPSSNYLSKYASMPSPNTDDYPTSNVADAASSFHHVVATGPPCPSPVVSPDLWNQQVMMTSRNLQAARVFLGSVGAHALSIDELWYLCMTVCQHLSWLLGMRPTSTGLFSKERTESDTQGNGLTTITSAAMADIPVLVCLMLKYSICRCDESLVRQGYLGLRLIAADFLHSIPFDCVSALVEAITIYGKQLADHNIALSALTQLWTVSDFVYRKSESVGADAAEKVWLVLYTCLSELCVDGRPPVRKSACQTLLQTVVAHGHALRPITWNHMIWKVNNFGSAWEAMLSYLEWAACYENAELSLSAIKSFQEILLGKISAQTLDINTRERSNRSAWQRMSRGLARMGAAASHEAPSGVAAKGAYVPGPSHLTTLLHTFPSLFERIARHICVDELKFGQLPSILENKCHSLCRRLSHNFLLHKKPFLMQFALFTMNVALPVVIYARLLLITFAYYCDLQHLQYVLHLESYLQDIKIMYSYSHMYVSPMVLIFNIPAEHFSPLWTVICDTLEMFLFTPKLVLYKFVCYFSELIKLFHSICSRLAADERKRDELVECQVVELVRSELLSHSPRLPSDTVQRLIALLNRGSISQLDPTDVLDSHAQRAELARACFDALLSTSSDGDGRLGHVAVTSLLQRCSQVMVDFVRDWSGAGDLRLPRSRISEMISALQAVDSLIARLARDPSLSELYSQLVSLFPVVVDVVQCSRADPQLESQLTTTLKSYQTLLLLKAVPHFIS